MTDTTTKTTAGANGTGVSIEHHGGGAAHQSQTGGSIKTGDVTYRPPLDLYDLEDRYEVHVDLPGATPDSIDVTLNDGVLSIGAHVPPRYERGITPLLGEFGVGDFRRQVRLGEDIDADGLTASYAEGVLTVKLPKRAERRPRRIAVQAG